MAEWWAAGARGFGLGADLYKPGQSAGETADKARAAVAACRALARG
jgi:2-dehydro-3-deoxyphosphogalactonate aldolase